jgi:aminoglycoside phosphotransferase (APT) family kinase protein
LNCASYEANVSKHSARRLSSPVEIQPISRPVLSDRPDVEWLRERLGRCIWLEHEIPCPIAEVRVHHHKYSRRGTTALYDVVFDASGDRAVEQLYIGYELEPAALDAAYAAAVSEATRPPALGRTVVRIPEANLLLVAFPNDRRMHVADEKALHACLGRVALVMANRGQRRGHVWQVKDASFSVLRYAAGQRLTLRCRGSFETDQGVEHPFSFIAKQFRRPDEAKALYRTLVALQEHFADTRRVWLPRPVAFDDQTGLVLMEQLPGKDLLEALAEVDLGETMWGAGQMLATFHQAPRLVHRTASVQQKIDDIRDLARKVEKFFPSALPHLRACLARMLSVRWTDDAPDVLLHGAFRPKHVFVHGGRLALIDVDGICVGHPAHDIGHFLSALYYHEAQGLLSATDRSLAVSRFLQGYAARAPWRLQPVAVLWCTAAQLVHKQARKYVVHNHGDREEKVDHVLSLAERVLAGCGAPLPGVQLDVVLSLLC